MLRAVRRPCAAVGTQHFRCSSGAPPAAPPPGLALPALAERLATPEVLDALRTRGWAMVDGALGETWCHLLRDDIVTLVEQRALQSNATHLVRGGQTTLLPKVCPPNAFFKPSKRFPQHNVFLRQFLLG